MIPFWVAIIGFAAGFCLGVAIISCFAWRNYNRGYKDGYWEVITTAELKESGDDETP